MLLRAFAKVDADGKLSIPNNIRREVGSAGQLVELKVVGASKHKQFCSPCGRVPKIEGAMRGSQTPLARDIRNMHTTGLRSMPGDRGPPPAYMLQVEQGGWRKRRGSWPSAARGSEAPG